MEPKTMIVVFEALWSLLATAFVVIVWRNRSLIFKRGEQK